MNSAAFDLADEQLDLRRSVRDAAAADRVAALELDGLIVPEVRGGLGGSHRDLAVVFEELGAALSQTTLLGSGVLAGSLLTVLGDPADMLPGVCDGTTVAAVAGRDGQVVFDGDRLHGSARYVLDGLRADVLLVRAGSGIYAVDPSSAGLARLRAQTFDPTRPLATVEFGGVAAHCLGSAEALDRALDTAGLALAAEQLGGARQAFEMAVGYAKERFQFGRAIGSFQAIKHLCADLLLDLEGARSGLYYAAWCADRAEPTTAQAALALARSCCSDVFVASAAANIQIHGGIGFTWEHPAHLYLRRARSSAVLLGDAAGQRDRFVRLLRSGVTLPPAEPPREVARRPHNVAEIAADTLEAHGSDELKAELLADFRDGKFKACLLYSEPDAGSDLAGLRTRADFVGTRFVVNGQKVWTSAAAKADYGLLLARTDADVPKHQGLSLFLIPMRQPGIEVRPLRQITGDAHFNEVFLTDAEVPAHYVIGSLGDGWKVLQTALIVERSMMGERNAGVSTRRMHDESSDLLALAERHGRADDPVMVQAIAHAEMLRLVQQWNDVRGRAERARSEQSAASAVAKLGMSRLLHTTAQVQRDILGAEVLLDGPDYPEANAANFLTLNAFFTSIGGGTDQIQRNIIGERLLGLPREPSVDRDVPFSQAPS